jgi:hypothetical protein
MECVASLRCPSQREAIVDWQAWRKALELYGNTPELIYASIFVAIAIFGFTWWLRSHISKERIAALQERLRWQGGSRAHQKRIGLVEAKSFSTGDYH